MKKTIILSIILVILLSSLLFANAEGFKHVNNKSKILKSEILTEELEIVEIIEIIEEVVLSAADIYIEDTSMFVEVPECKDININIMLLGDVCLATNYGQRNGFHSKYDKEGPEFVFEHIKPYFDRADYVIANLENVFTDRKEYQKGKIYTYKADSKYADVIYKSGITHFALVNNHMQDYLQSGFDDSVKLLESGGIKWFGTNEHNTSSVELGSIKVDKKEVIDKDGFRIGLLSYYGFNNSFASDKIIDRDVKYLKDIENVDYIISYIHWGGQGTYPILKGQTDFGRKLVDKGVDLVVGGHPHVVQTMEVYNGKHIYYSLGDFMFVHRSTPKDPDSILIDLKLTKDVSGNISENFEYVPVLWGGAVNKNHYTPKVGTQVDIDRALKKLNVKGVK